MKIGMVGLGRMGSNMVRRLLAGGHECVVFDQDASKAGELKGAEPAGSLEALCKALKPPRAVWVMLPAGEVTDQAIRQAAGFLSVGDVLVDGGNTYYKDDIRRAETLRTAGIHYLDAGTSGGVWGLERGYCLMIGGPQEAFETLKPVLECLAPGEKDKGEGGLIYCGPTGAGHFAKMVHNGIEYGLMQSYAEGFELLSRAPGYQYDLAGLAKAWGKGSVVSSWLLELCARALAEDPGLKGFEGSVEDSGEGRWTVQAAIEQAVPAEVLTAALYRRFRSRSGNTFGEKLLSAMRHQFGGHVEARKTKKP
jgi:6-phosphogluconate dehydrogenase